MLLLIWSLFYITFVQELIFSWKGKKSNRIKCRHFNNLNWFSYYLSLRKKSCFVRDPLPIPMRSWDFCFPNKSHINLHTANLLSRYFSLSFLNIVSLFLFHFLRFCLISCTAFYATTIEIISNSKMLKCHLSQTRNNNNSVIIIQISCTSNVSTTTTVAHTLFVACCSIQMTGITFHRWCKSPLWISLEIDISASVTFESLTRKYISNFKWIQFKMNWELHSGV